MTGCAGLCGRRLVEMLVERGEYVVVVAVDVQDCDWAQALGPAVEFRKGSICSQEFVDAACQNVDVVFHLAALVGPFYTKEQYEAVNHQGSLNILNACQKAHVKKLIYSSSPSTRITGDHVRGLKEEQMPIAWGKFLETYAETKAKAEAAILGANSANLMTISVSPHQVYGERDALFLPNFLHAAFTGRLRVFGNGENSISVCYVDNYCHALMLAEKAMVPGATALGRYYVITDDKHVNLWRFIDSAVMYCGYPSLFEKARLPTSLLYGIAHVGRLFGSVKLTPYTVTMLTIDRYFDISNARRDLSYEPLISHEQAWQKTLAWFKQRPELYTTKNQ